MTDLDLIKMFPPFSGGSPYQVCVGKRIIYHPFCLPVSTTHTITGAIIGVGSVKRLSAVRWGVTQKLLVAWILTIPVSALIAAAVYFTAGKLLY
jgi:phosphate/sulfate permease